MTRVVVTGATGNVGTSVVQALGQSSAISEVVGVARRAPAWTPARTVWQTADILSSDLTSIFRDADVVIHLAWAIQPSRDEPAMERINVDGTRRVLDAITAAEVPKLVYASSVGAYSKGPKDQAVDESWPIGGTPSSFYARHKAAVERLLDQFESEQPATAVVRLRPALIFKGEAASEIRRLFAGPFLPGFLIRPRALPVMPRIRGLRFQAVHSRDVAQAYLRAATRDVRGSFNIAADPPIDSERLAELFDARTVEIPASLVRRLTEFTWRLHIQPTPPGWLDMALEVPLMSSARAKRELEWEPRFSAIAALEELIQGMRAGAGFPTPPLEEGGAKERAQEVRTGVGSRQ
jgi:nucleoside-diphosphate-sugar epimerase